MGKYKVGDEFWGVWMHGFRRITKVRGNMYGFVWDDGTRGAAWPEEAIDRFIQTGQWKVKENKTTLIRKFKEIYGEG